MSEIPGKSGLVAALLLTILLLGCAGYSNNQDNFSGGQKFAGAETATQTAAAPQGSGQLIQVGDKTTAAAPESYRIGPGDVLEITVFKVPDLSKIVEVAETGSINLPLLGEVPAAGKTAQQLERDLTAKLGKTYLQNPQVSVLVKENNSQKVSIQGAVKKPGVYPIKGRTSLLELVATAGGLEESSDSTVLILRNKDGKRTAAKFDVSAIQSGKEDDPSLQSGDQLVAGTSAIKTGFGYALKILGVSGRFIFF